jgi:hypothetical protein
MRQVRKQIRSHLKRCEENQPADLRFERPDLERVGELLQRIDSLLSE